MLYEQISPRRDEFRLKSANHILVKMSNITDRAQMQPFCTSCVLGQIFLFHSVNAPVPLRHQE